MPSPGSRWPQSRSVASIVRWCAWASRDSYVLYSCDARFGWCFRYYGRYQPAHRAPAWRRQTAEVPAI